MELNGYIWQIWIEHNNRHFQDKELNIPIMVTNMIIVAVKFSSSVICLEIVFPHFILPLLHRDSTGLPFLRTITVICYWFQAIPGV